MPAGQPLSSQDANRKACRICLDDEPPFISPCDCRGTAKFVHRSCLDEWRAQQSVPLAFTHCSVCRFEYEVTDAQPEASRLVRFRLAVARDTLLLFATVQTVIALFAVLLHALDRAINCRLQPDWTVPCNTSFIPHLFPTDWADRTSVAHLSLGPYYVSSVLILLALLGLMGLLLWCTDMLPRTEATGVPSEQWQVASASRATPTTARGATGADDLSVSGNEVRLAPSGKQIDAQAAAAEMAVPPMRRSQSRRSQSRRRGNNCGGERCCECHGCYCSDPCPGNCNGCNCNDCKCDGEGALAVVVVVFIIFVLIGVFVGVFFATIAIQRIVQRHMHLLNMRTAAQRFPVVDLGATGDEEQQQDVNHAARSQHGEIMVGLRQVEEHGVVSSSLPAMVRD